MNFDDGDYEDFFEALFEGLTSWKVILWVVGVLVVGYIIYNCIY